MARRNPPLGRRTGTLSPRQQSALVAGWTPEQVASARQGAARGDYREWASLVDILFTDDHVRATTESLIASVSGADVEWSPGGDDADAQRARDLIAAAWAKVHADTALRADIAVAQLTGASVVQQTWGSIIIEGRRYAAPIEHDPVLLRDIRIGDDWTAEVRTYDDSGAWAGVGSWIRTDYEPERWLVAYARFPGVRRTLAGALLACAWPWLGKLRLSVFELVGLEKFGDPVMALIGSQNGTREARDAGIELVEALSAGESVYIEEGTQIQIVESARQTGQAHADAIARRDAAISKAILGSTLNTEIGAAGGNRAAAESQAETTILPRQRALAELVSETIQEQWAAPILRYAGLEGAALPEMTIVLEQEELPQLDQGALAAGAYTVNDLLRASGLPPLDGPAGERVARPQSPPEAPSAQAMAMAGVATQVAQGALTRDSAAGILRVAYRLDDEDIDRVLGTTSALPEIAAPEPVETSSIADFDPAPNVARTDDDDDDRGQYEFAGFLRLSGETQDTITQLVGRPREALARGVSATEDIMRAHLAELADAVRGHATADEAAGAIAAWAAVLAEDEALATAAFEASALAQMAGVETARFELDEVPTIAASRPRYLTRFGRKRLDARDERGLKMEFERALEAFQSRRRYTAEQLDAMLESQRTRGVTIARATGEHAELAMLDELERALRVDGLTIDEWADRIAGYVDADDLPGGLRGYAENLYRTTIATSYEAGRQEELFDPEVVALLGGYEWSAVGDDRTRPTHMALDGVQFRAEDAARLKLPPAGHQCRCELLAIDAEDLDESRVADPSAQDPAFAEGFGDPAAYVRGG